MDGGSAAPPKHCVLVFARSSKNTVQHATSNRQTRRRQQQRRPTSRTPQRRTGPDRSHTSISNRAELTRPPTTPTLKIARRRTGLKQKKVKKK